MSDEAPKIHASSQRNSRAEPRLALRNMRYFAVRKIRYMVEIMGLSKNQLTKSTLNRLAESAVSLTTNISK